MSAPARPRLIEVDRLVLTRRATVSQHLIALIVDATPPLLAIAGAVTAFVLDAPAWGWLLVAVAVAVVTAELVATALTDAGDRRKPHAVGGCAHPPRRRFLARRQAISMIELGCPVCREGAYRSTEPRFVTSTSGVDGLYRCSACSTWWVGDSRTMHPATWSEAHARFPAEVPE